MMTAFAANPAPPGAAAPAEIPCPMCDYNLHGLTVPRCPECGYAFDWADLLDATRRKHKYLFEHHPERNVWSFCRTAVGGLAPSRFWRSLRPEQPSNLRRLIVYWLITALGVCALDVGGYTLTTVYYNANNVRARAFAVRRLNTPQGRADAQGIIDQLGSVERYLDEFCPVAPSRAFFVLTWRAFWRESTSVVNTAGIVCFLTLPWVTALSLMLFQATMRRARIHGSHVLRCCLYSFDGGWWFGLVIGACFAAAIADALPSGNFARLEKVLSSSLGLISAALLVSGIVKLLFAYRLYMRFPHAIATVMLALAVAFLLLTTVVVNLPGMYQPLLDVLRSLYR